MKELPFSSVGLHPAQIAAMRDHVSLDEDEFAAILGTDRDIVSRWETEGVSTGPTAAALRAAAHFWDFEFPEVPGAEGTCTICETAAYHVVSGLPVCRSCFLTPVESMLDVGFEVESNWHIDARDRKVEITAPKTWGVQMPLANFGPEDWKTAVKKLRHDEPEIGVHGFDDDVYIAAADEEAMELLKDEVVRGLVIRLVGDGEVEVVGVRVRVKGFDRAQPSPLREVALRAGLLIRRLHELR